MFQFILNPRLHNDPGDDADAVPAAPADAPAPAAAAPAPPVAAPAGVAPAPPAVLRRGRQRGYTWTLQQRDRFTRKLAERRLERQEQVHGAHLRALDPGRAEGGLGKRRHDVAYSILGSSSKACRRGDEQRHDISWHFTGDVDDGGDVGVGVPPSMKNIRNKRRGLKKRAFLSHVRSMRSRLSQFMSGSTCLIVSSTIDDANLWIAKHAENGKEVIRVGKKGRSGRNAHMPCLNNVQLMTTCRADGSRDVARMPVPTTVLPKTNWTTLHKRWRRWSFSGLRAGRAIVASAADHHIQPTIDECPDAALLLCKDSLVTNQCLTSEEELQFVETRRSLATANPGRHVYRAFLDSNCQQHTACLCTRPVYQQSGQLSTMLVKLGHQLESGTVWARFLVEKDKLIDEEFDYVPVLVLPPEAAAWRRSNLDLLESSKATLDLTDDDILDLVDYDNGSSWQMSRKWRHLCLPDCRFNCNRNRNTSLATCVRINNKLVASGPPISLLYRFKHVEVANAWEMRNQGCHQLLPRIY